MPEFPKVLTHGSGVEMVLDPTRVLVATRTPRDQAALAAAAAVRDLVLEDDAPVAARGLRGAKPETVNHTATRYWLREREGAPVSDAQVAALSDELGGDVAWVGPVYRLPDVPGRGGYVCPLPHVILLGEARRQDPRGDRALRRALADAGAQEVDERSKLLPGFRYFELSDPSTATSYEVRRRLQEAGGARLPVELETMPMIVPTTLEPGDPLFVDQWNMVRIRAGGPGRTGWDVEQGSPPVVIAILDQGIDRGHADLDCTVAGINLGTMSGDGSPTGIHGTPCAGIAAARIGNGAGVAGVAGGCKLMPIAFENWTDAECAAGITYAATNGAHVISMSFGVYAPGDGMGPTGWNFAVIDPAIAQAVDVDGLVLCAATGNEDYGVVNRYPARNPRVIAVGASDEADGRKNPASPDGEWWGSNFGPGMDVMAPGVHIPTTDIVGAGGYDPGDYATAFNGTSAATPHVAGFAALLRSEYPALTPREVRDVIERTAAKVGPTPYADDPAMPNGVSNPQMGYGRIDVLQGLDFADVGIDDWWGDTGAEPSAPPGGNFWTYSDIVVRINDDDVFQPDDPTKSSNIERGQTNHLYVRVTNHGPAAARNVVVTARITPYVGTEFVYPHDWTAIDAQHVAPTPVTASFASIPAGTSQIAKFRISAAQVEDVWGWISGHSWHPCIVAAVTADNDYAFASASTAGGGLIVRRNNLAQRNVSVIDVLASATVTFPFVIGSREGVSRDHLELRIDRSRIPFEAGVELLVEEDLTEVLPRIAPDIVRGGGDGPMRIDGPGFRFLDRVRVELGGPQGGGVLLMEPGSRLATAAPAPAPLTVQGGSELVRDGRRLVRVEDPVALIRFSPDEATRRPVALRMTIPPGARVGETFPLTVTQTGPDGRAVGGATVVYRVREA